VELDSPLGTKHKKGKINTALNGDASMKRCIAGSPVKKNLEANEPGVIGESDAAGMDWEEGHVSVVECKDGYSHDLGETVTVEFTDDVPSSAEKKSVRRHTAEEKVKHFTNIFFINQGICVVGAKNTRLSSYHYFIL
jgi:xeroderma pigmentosum group C-complementing protein